MTQLWRRASWELGDWIRYAHEIDARRCGRPRDEAVRRHIALFPADLVAVELDRPVLNALCALLENRISLFGRPGRGYRANHWTTPALMTAKNQIERLNRITGQNAQSYHHETQHGAETLTS